MGRVQGGEVLGNVREPSGKLGKIREYWGLLVYLPPPTDLLNKLGLNGSFSRYDTIEAATISLPYHDDDDDHCCYRRYHLDYGCDYHHSLSSSASLSAAH